MLNRGQASHYSVAEPTEWHLALCTWGSDYGNQFYANPINGSHMCLYRIDKLYVVCIRLSLISWVFYILSCVVELFYDFWCLCMLLSTWVKRVQRDQVHMPHISPGLGPSLWVLWCCRNTHPGKLTCPISGFWFFVFCLYDCHPYNQSRNHPLAGHLFQGCSMVSRRTPTI